MVALPVGLAPNQAVEDADGGRTAWAATEKGDGNAAPSSVKNVVPEQEEKTTAAAKLDKSEDGMDSSKDRRDTAPEVKAGQGDTRQELPVEKTAPQAVPEEPQGCSHADTQEVIPPTCTSEGYTLYTCRICGEQHANDYVAPRHEGKYVCEVCGLPMPDADPQYALAAWIIRNTQRRGGG